MNGSTFDLGKSSDNLPNWQFGGDLINVQGVADRPRVDPRYVMRNFKPPREGEADYSAPPGFRCSGAPARSRGSGG